MPPLAPVAVVLWTIAIGAGWAAMLDYEFKTLEQPLGLAGWPDEALPREPGRSTVVVCLHPKCPCSQATLTELERVLARPEVAASRPIVIALLTVPLDADESWTASALAGRCAQLPRARVVLDAQGAISSRFGAVASGDVQLFDSGGTRRFAGGITISRGHEGPSTGGDALAAMLSGRPSELWSTPVFGCRLVAPNGASAPSTPATRL